MRPTTFDGWRLLLAYQAGHQLYTSTHYVFTAWVDAKTKPAYKRRDIDWYLLKETSMKKWCANTWRVFSPGWDASTIEVAKYLQYKGMPVRGCPWINTGFSMDLCLVCGSQIATAIGIILEKSGKGDPAKRQVQTYVLGMIIEALATPGGYKEACSRLRLSIASIVNIIPWDPKNATNVTMDDDDAYHFALQWVLDCETNRSKDWNTERVTRVLAKARTGPSSRSTTPHQRGYVLRPVDLPWKTTIENDAQYRAVWKHELRVPCSKGWVHGPEYHAYVRANPAPAVPIQYKSPRKSLAARLSAPVHVNAYGGNRVLPPSTIPGKPPVVIVTYESAPATDDTLTSTTSMDVDNQDTVNDEECIGEEADMEETVVTGEAPDLHDQTEEDNYADLWATDDGAAALPDSPFDDSLLPG
ncbi:hypothetical protein C8J57DRAFT_1533001 [Mycena rebaudengoi]|nr:hypothetical protein C8J57DRAFT_1533001 [Mycena rebaudengoi]